jgi:hypothetical protein
MELNEAIAQHLLEVHECSNWTEVDLAHTVLAMTLAKATTPTASIDKNLQGTIAHVHYHLGQIVLLKKLVCNQQEHHAG